MKARYVPMIAAVGFALALPCLADQTVVTPAPQTGAQPTAPPAASVPPSYVWDGYEYVGKSGGKYYYLGPRNTWQTLDTDRRQRFEQWQRAHPDWRDRQIRNTEYLGHDQGQSQLQPMPNTTEPDYRPAPPDTNNPPQP